MMVDTQINPPSIREKLFPKQLDVSYIHSYNQIRLKIEFPNFCEIGKLCRKRVGTHLRKQGIPYWSYCFLYLRFGRNLWNDVSAFIHYLRRPDQLHLNC